MNQMKSLSCVKKNFVIQNLKVILSNASKIMRKQVISVFNLYFYQKRVQFYQEPKDSIFSLRTSEQRQELCRQL